MIKGDKELLLKDLCARLPYNTKFRYEYVDSFGRTAYSTSIITGIRFPNYVEHCLFTGTDYLHIEKGVVKPYLFPLSSMTEEQKEEWRGIRWSKLPWDELNWLNKGHWDYRHLIEKGLAIDATGLNIY